MGRKSKYTPERVERILACLRLGQGRVQAALNGGITFETFSVWQRTKSDFSELVEKAEADGELRDLKRIDDAAENGQWQAAAWKLERRNRDRWGRRERIDFHNAVEVAQVTELKELEAELRRRLREKDGNRIGKRS